MNEPAVQLYTLSGATGEIFIMLLVSFVLGALLGRVLASGNEVTIAPLPASTPRLKKDDLKVIEGIGPSIEALLYKSGIFTWQMLSQTPIDRLARLLEHASGGPLTLQNFQTWPQQAGLAARGDWTELKKLQEILVAGVTPKT